MAVLLKTPLIIRNDADLIRVSKSHPGYRFEREADGAIFVSPTSTNDGARSAEALVQLAAYAKRYGGKAFDSSTGFAVGPGQTIRSPDASWVSAERIASLEPHQRTGFWPISPDVAIEVRSRTDDIEELVAKTRAYLERGTRYAVALDPQSREAHEFGQRPDGLILDFDAIFDA